MRDLGQITMGIVETSLTLERADLELLDLAMNDPENSAAMDAVRRRRVGLIARLDRLTQLPDAVPLRLAS